MLDQEKILRRLMRAASRTLDKYDEACERHQLEVQIFQADVARRVRDFAQRSGDPPTDSPLDRLRRTNGARAGEGPRPAPPSAPPPSPPPSTPPSPPPPPSPAATADHDELTRLRDRLRATEADLLVAHERERRLQAELALAHERQRVSERDAELAHLREQLAAARASTTGPAPAPPILAPPVATPRVDLTESAPSDEPHAPTASTTASAPRPSGPATTPDIPIITPELIADPPPDPSPASTPHRPTVVVLPSADTPDQPHGVDPDAASTASERGPLDRARRALARGDVAEAHRHFADAEAEARGAWTGHPDTHPAAHVLAAALRGGAELALERADLTAALAKSSEAVALVLDLHVAAPSALTLCDLLASLRIKATALLAAGCPRDAEAQIIDALDLFEQEDPRRKDLDVGYEVTFLIALQDELHRPAGAPRT